MPIDYIAGTSMGSIIGGLYASGMTPDEIEAALNFGVLAELRAGLRKSTGDVEMLVGSPELPDYDFDSGSFYGRFTFDSYDNFFFPTNGSIVFAEYELFRDALGSDDSFEQLRSRATFFRTFAERHTVGVGARYSTTMSGDAPVQDLFRLGGFLGLSGLPDGSVIGQHTALAQAIYYRRAPLIPFFTWYVGGSLELGNAWDSRSDISVSSASSAFRSSAAAPPGVWTVAYSVA